MFERKLPSPYRSREATIDAWTGLGHEPEAVTRVLTLLSRALRLPTSDGLRLRPDDQVWALYHCFYPRLIGWRRRIGSRPDELELETLLRDLQKAAPLGTNVELHADVTVADLVKLFER